MARYGLIVGVSQYSRPLGNLSKTGTDAEAVRMLLLKHGDFDDLPILVGKVTREELEVALVRLFRQSADRQEALIYFAGHGVVVQGAFGQQRGYLALTDTKLTLSQKKITGIENGIALDDLSSLIGEATLSNLVVLLDCCHSEVLLEQSQGFFQRAIITQAFTTFKKDYFLVSACRQFEEAVAYRSQKHSIFTASLLHSLKQEQINERGIINASSMYSIIAEQLRGSGQEAVDLGFGGGSIRMVDYRTVEPQNVPKDICPYVGLEAFTAKTACFFKGRDRFVQLLLEKISESNFVPVIGASGSGKSSLVRAGLIPILENSSNWQVLPPIKPGDSRREPINEISRVLSQQCQWNEDKANVEAAIDAGNLTEAVDYLPGLNPLLLVIDQFEEVFTVCPPEKETERRKFLDLLVELTQHSDSRLRIVTTMRADFFENCLNYRGLGEVIQANQVLLLPMNEVELWEAVEAPATIAKYNFEPGLLHILLQEVREEQNILPLLEFALTQLWRRRQGRTLTLAAYRELGGVSGALNRKAEEIFSSIRLTDQAWIQRICLKLVRIGEGEKDTRQRQPKRDILELATGIEQQALQRVLEKLLQGRLLVTYSDAGIDWVDLAHESLMTGWEQFVTWRQKNRDQRRLVQRVLDAEDEWQQKDQAEGYLLQGGLLAEVRDHWSLLEAALDQNTRYYYQESVQREQQKVALLERALSEARLREEALQIMNLTTDRPAPATAAQAIRSVGESINKLEGQVLKPLQSNLLKVISRIRECNCFQGHSGAVFAVAFNPDGETFISGSADCTLQLWDLQGNLICNSFQGHSAFVMSVAFSPDGQTIISGSDDKTLRLWDLEGNLISKSFQGHIGSIRSVAFSPDGQTIVSGSRDKTLRIWDLQGNPIGGPFHGHSQDVMSVAFSPDGQTIISGSDDKTLRLWDLEGNLISKPFQGHTDPVNSVAFSPDGKTIVSGSGDGTLRLWDLQGKSIGEPFRGHFSAIRSVNFSPDGLTIASSGATVRLWDLNGNSISEPCWGHSDVVWSVAFSPDGSKLISSGGQKDKTIRMWNFEDFAINKSLQGHSDLVWSVAFSPDGQNLVSGSRDNTLRLWDIKGSPIGKPFRGHTQAVTSVAFSPDGKIIISVGADLMLQAWDLQGKPISKLNQKIDGFGLPSVAFSPNGQLIVSANYYGPMQLWNLQNNHISKPFSGHSDFVSTVKFNPDGQLIIAGDGEILQLWDLQGTPVGDPFRGHSEGVNSVAFSPDGQTIVSGSSDKTIRLWDLQGTPLGDPFRGHSEGVNSVAFSPDGQWIASSGGDNTIRLWHGGNWYSWLARCCNRLRNHPIFQEPLDDIAREACAVCQRLVWDLE